MPSPSTAQIFGSLISKDVRRSVVPIAVAGASFPTAYTSGAQVTLMRIRPQADVFFRINETADAITGALAPADEFYDVVLGPTGNTLDAVHVLPVTPAATTVEVNWHILAP